MSELENLNIGELCVHYKVCGIKPCHAHCGEYLPKDHSVTDRPHGEWIRDDFGDFYKSKKCSECGLRVALSGFYFCPNCGSDNRPKEGEKE